MTTSRRQRRSRPGGLDLAVTLVLLLFLVVGGLSLSFLALLNQMSVAACSGNPAACNDDLLAWAFYLTPLVAALGFLATLFGLIVRKPWSLQSWWIPTVGIAAMITAFVVSLFLVDIAIP